MSALSTITAGIEAAERELMHSTCRATRPGALSGTIDPATGLDTGATPTPVWTGKCWIPPLATGAQATTGGDVIVVQTASVSLPVSATALEIGDQLEILSSPNGTMTGRRFTVTATPLGDLVVMATYQVESIS